MNQAVRHGGNRPAPAGHKWISDADALSLLAGKGSWRQYPAYAAQAAARVSATSRYLLVGHGAEPIALANLRTRFVPVVGGYTLVSNGPVLLRERSMWEEDLTAFGDVLGRIASLEKLGEVVIDPPVGWSLQGLDPVPCLAGFALDPAGRPYRTFLMNVAQDEESLLGGLSREWRKELKRGLRAGFEVRVSDRPEDFMLLDPLLKSLADRKDFELAQDCAFFARVAANASGPERFLVHLVSKEGELMAGQIAAYSGEIAVGLLGAASPEGLRTYASRVTYWEVMRTAREMGFSHYDLGGYDPEENPDVFKFKKRMGGEDRATPGAMVRPAQGAAGGLLRLARKVRQRLRQ